MKLADIKYIWVLQDQYGDIQTEFFYPEEVEFEVPRSLEKDLMYMLDGDKHKLIRLKVGVEGHE